MTMDNQTCPPCNGYCRQGRDCPADPPLTRKGAWIALALIVTPWAVLGIVIAWLLA